MLFLFSLAALFSTTFGANIDYKRGNYGGKSTAKGPGWSDWESTTSVLSSSSGCSMTAVTCTVSQPCPPFATSTVTSTVETTTTLPGQPITSTTTYTETLTHTMSTYCTPSPTPTPCCNGTINFDALLVAIKAYFDTTFIEELNATLVESISNTFTEVAGVEIDNSVHEAISKEFVAISTTLSKFEENITQSINISVDNSLQRYVDNTLITTIDQSIDKTITEAFNQDILTNINETFFAALQNYTYNTNITLDGSSLHYLNSSISDVMYGYMHTQFTETDSSLMQDLRQSLSSYSYDDSPWYAITILTLLVIFAILTLAGLLWLIFRDSKPHNQMGRCPDCGAPQDQCACGT
ncbi:hypothetical protein EDD36DRAFT_465636 [Exophiala viscosa]|uniref:Uncharacterized protein n=1 Tax=Exophiala viscosa TaxID=2486360 RepID=A0AAN6DT87_9EURO|nr:hypothetical protein EDD36DRAFT_465636 [Exophiala viscosa]